MAKIGLVLIVASLVVGCASHYDKSTFKTPLQEGFRECAETANGSTSCESNYESKEFSAGGYMPFGGLYGGTAMHPPVLFRDQSETTAGQRGLERIAGGAVVLHPAVQTEPCVGDDCSTLPKDVDRLGRVVVKLGEQVKELKEKEKK